MKKTEEFKVRLSPDEKNTLLKKAGQAHISQSEYVRRLIMGETVHEYNSELVQGIKNVTNEINKIGVNINQIVHNLNMNKYTEYEKKKLFSYLQEVYDKVSALVEKVYSD